jgi:hypothetical protein
MENKEKYKLTSSEYEMLKIHSEDSRLKDINLLRDLKKQGFFKKIPGTATIKDILTNCEVFE